MKKGNLFMILLVAVTVVCIVFGTFMHAGLLSHRGFHFDYTFGNDSKKESAENGTTKLDVFTKIDMDLNTTDVKITNGDDYAITVEAANKDILPTYSVDNGTLELSQEQNNNIFGLHDNSCTLEITVPKDAEIKEITGEVTVGDINIEETQADTIDLTADVGGINLYKVTAKDITLSGRVGDVIANVNDFNSMELSTNTGDITIVSAKDLDNYDLDLDSGVGSISVNGKDQGDSYSQNGNEGSIEADSDVGDVCVNY